MTAISPYGMYRVIFCLVVLYIVRIFFTETLQLGFNDDSPQQSRIQNNMPEDSLLSVYTVATTSQNKGFCSTIESANANGFDLLVLGLWQNFNVYDLKIVKLSLFLKAAEDAIDRYGPDHIMLTIDAFDVLFQQPASYFVEQFKAFNTSIVYSAENNCWPFQQNYYRYYKPRHPNCVKQEEMASHMVDVYKGKGKAVQFLNSGAAIGRAGALKEWFTDSIELLQSGENDDQAIAAVLFLSGKYSVTIDLMSKMFMSMYDAANVVEHDESVGRYRNTATQSIPGILHFNGGKSVLPKFRDSMWYKRQNDFNPIQKGVFMPLKGNKFIPHSKVCQINRLAETFQPFI